MDGQEKRKTRISSSKHILVIIVLGLLIVAFASVYYVFRALWLFYPSHPPQDTIFGVALFLAEFFVFIHVLGFIQSILRSTLFYKTVQETYFATYSNPRVTCFICSYNEPVGMLEKTILAALSMDYENKEIVLLDDSTGIFSVQTNGLAKKYAIRLIHRTERRGYKAGAINNGLQSSRAKYFVVFDADQKPVVNFLKDLVFLLEEDKNLALIQTPQFYINTDNPVARAAWNRQSVFYEYICEGKSTSNAMFCCGSNFIARREAIDRIGGFDETVLTEDFATTLQLHKSGWKTLYYNIVYVLGLGPVSLQAYFSQQYRWAHGTVTTFKKIVASFIQNPRMLKPRQWWEYFLASTYFFTGWSNFIFMIVPVAFLLFDIRPFGGDSLAYLVSFIPYFVLSLVLFTYSMNVRGHTLHDLLLGQSISIVTFSVYMTADVAALLGLPASFSVTEKRHIEHLPLRLLWPQLTMLLVLIFAGPLVF